MKYLESMGKKSIIRCFKCNKDLTKANYSIPARIFFDYLTRKHYTKFSCADHYIDLSGLSK